MTDVNSEMTVSFIVFKKILRKVPTDKTGLIKQVLSTHIVSIAEIAQNNCTE